MWDLSSLLLLLLSRFSHVQLCATPQTAAHQAPPSLGFSRQEHWSGLPFPSPVHESEKWKWSRSVVSNSLWPHGLQPTRLLHPWDFPGKSTGVGCHCPGIKPISSALQGGFFTTGPPGRSLSFLYIYIYNFFRFLSIINYYKILNIVPCGPCYLSFSNVLFMTLFLL